MSTPFTSTTSSASAAVPQTREFTAAWIAYLLYTLSAFLFWPALIALIISYSKRGRSETGFIDSHHRWMLRSFWYSQLAFLAFFVLIMIGVWPIVSDLVHQVIEAGDWSGSGSGLTLNVDWPSIFTSVGSATVGGIGFGLTWLWFLYRMVRGMITLADARALP